MSWALHTYYDPDDLDRSFAREDLSSLCSWTFQGVDSNFLLQSFLNFWGPCETSILTRNWILCPFLIWNDYDGNWRVPLLLSQTPQTLLPYKLSVIVTPRIGLSGWETATDEYRRLQVWLKSMRARMSESSAAARFSCVSLCLLRSLRDPTFVQCNYASVWSRRNGQERPPRPRCGKDSPFGIFPRNMQSPSRPILMHYSVVMSISSPRLKNPIWFVCQYYSV